MMTFQPVLLDKIKDLRNIYFAEIILSQELFLEWLIKEANSYIIRDNEDVIGYFIINNENILLEFYLVRNYLTRKEKIFEEVILTYSVKKVYCKSFDAVLLVCAHTFCKSSEIIGTIFRDYNNDIVAPLDKDITVRLSLEEDIPFLQTFEDSELYDSKEELIHMVRNKMLYLFEREGALLGCGYLIRILPDRNYMDIGMWTHPAYRKQGYATKIISYLKNYCLQNGFIPVCGCDVSNAASRKTLEKNGFISKYSIIEFEL